MASKVTFSDVYFYHKVDNYDRRNYVLYDAFRFRERIKEFEKLWCQTLYKKQMLRDVTLICIQAVKE
jgi:hypothetical protein